MDNDNRSQAAKPLPRVRMTLEQARNIRGKSNVARLHAEQFKEELQKPR